jgi:hypothetical protein
MMILQIESIFDINIEPYYASWLRMSRGRFVVIGILRQNKTPGPETGPGDMDGHDMRHWRMLHGI